jgi:hypothetical protein
MKRPVTQLPVSEAITASAWGYTEQQWRALTEHQRQHCRWNITKAPQHKGQS